MKALDRKLIRDLMQMKGQATAITLVIASGVAMFVLALSAQHSLKLTLDTYYERYRFADVFTQMKRAPGTLIERIEQIPGVAKVQTRVVFDVNLDLPGMIEPAVGRLVSIPDRDEPLLNNIYLRAGRLPEPRQSDEVVISEGCAEAHNLQAGDKVVAILNGRRKELEIVGIALSPEYIYSIRPGDLLPDDERFGVFWMRLTPMEAAFDMDGAFNDVTVSVMPEANEAEILLRLDELTERYGGRGAFGREDQVSHRFISDEIAQLGRMAFIVPTIFLSVAAFLLNVVLNRMISTQREQIAAIKAFGYTHFEVGVHYLKFVMLVVLIGSVLGIVAGYFLGRDLTKMYTQFYRFPVLQYHLNASVVVLAIGVSAAAAVLGTIVAVRRAVQLPPAEAMRPEPPAHYRETFVERIGLQRLLTQPSRMILRHLERQPLKAFLSSFGIALSVSILILGQFMTDALDFMLDAQFNVAQRQNITLTYMEPRPARAIYEAQHLPGVMDIEPFRAVPARLRFKHRDRRIAVIGLPDKPRLQRLIDEELHEVDLPTEGLMLSEKLAEVMGLSPGDVATVEVLEGSRPVRQVPVAGVFSEFVGMSAYMNMEALNRVMREGSTVSGANLTADSAYLDELYTTLKETPAVASVTLKDAAIRSFEETIAENMLRMQAFNIFFAVVIAFGVVYNSARIALSERSRELATLRVIGLTRAEISFILLGELAVLTAVAIPLGMLLGYLQVMSASTFMDTELYRIPVFVSTATYAYAAAVVIVAAFLSGLIVRRRLDHLDLVEVLKTRE